MIDDVVFRLNCSTPNSTLPEPGSAFRFMRRLVPRPAHLGDGTRCNEVGSPLSRRCVRLENEGMGEGRDTAAGLLAARWAPQAGGTAVSRIRGKKGEKRSDCAADLGFLFPRLVSSRLVLVPPSCRMKAGKSSVKYTLERVAYIVVSKVRIGAPLKHHLWLAGLLL